MRNLIKAFVLLLCAVLILKSGLLLSIDAIDTDVMPCYDNTESAEIYLNFSQNIALCEIFIRGNSNTSKIAGNITLYDETVGRNVASRTVYEEKSFYTNSFSAKVTDEHTYTLLFSGYVLGQDGTCDNVSISTTKKN